MIYFNAEYLFQPYSPIRDAGCHGYINVHTDGIQKEINGEISRYVIGYIDAEIPKGLVIAFQKKPTNLLNELCHTNHSTDYEAPHTH